jgi:fibro-slime domain-containing protein
MRATKAVFRALGAGSILSVVIAGFSCSGPAPVGDNTHIGGYTPGTGTPTNAGGGGGTAGAPFTLPNLGGVTGGGGSSAEETIPWPPPGFVNVTQASVGDYAVSKDPLGSTSGDGGSSGTAGRAKCTNILFGIVRDFQMSSSGGSNPDFEHSPAGDKGIVLDTLGSDGKPVYGDHPDGTATTHGPDNFNQWYNDVEGVNMSYVVGLHFVQKGGLFTFAATLNNTGGVPNVSYFPLDGQGFGNQDQSHNYSFTTEIHTSFTYNGGETFTFQGDDDVWVFINDKLAIDLGGIHAQQNQTVTLDTQAEKLGISKGNSYSLAVFNAERHVTQSNFRIDTTMTFDNCGIIPIQIF